MYTISENRSPYIGAIGNLSSDYDLVYIKAGRGQCFVGDYISDFSEGDIMLLGPDIKSYWHNDKHYEETGIRAWYIHIQFENQFLEALVRGVADLESIAPLFENSKQGLRFDKTNNKLSKLLSTLVSSSGANRFQQLLALLIELNDSPKKRILVHESHIKQSIKLGNKRVDKVYEYILDNYNESIALSNAATLIHMSNSSFCQFFKRYTGRSFYKVVNEVRIGHACKKLIQTDESVLNICFDSGFNNISNFNRRFKEQTGMSPLKYRKKRGTLSGLG